MAEWTPIACIVADIIRTSPHLQPYGGRTDLSGMYGEPSVYTEWGIRDRDTPVMREWRYPGPEGEPDPRPCRHEVRTRIAAEGGAS